MRIRKIKIADLLADQNNVREHSDQNLQVIQSSLERFGQQKPIVIDKEGVVRAGNGTLLAAERLGWKVIEAVETELAAEEATAYAIADNRASDLASWNVEALGSALETLKNFDTNLLDVLQFDQFELDSMLRSVAEFEPEFEPEFDPTGVTPGEVSKTGEALDGQFQGEQQLREVTCPHCGKTFEVESNA